ncbi:PREDICTED: uncharacterized protein LOC109216785 [Nicotiana attenuata]|uniref:uncharacterized protein LOC109216785 n=1 Tax=Nicotiana attenuata TaxID=49451 RepID=UPI000904C1D1|nr:PREDICTED: uncharacterized protein LOC109216785 [Nicotiana attenuata]
MVIGDFNSALNVEDRIGGNEVTWAEVVDFYNCVVECGLMELPTQGNRYTWSDKQEEHRIFSKIDWIFINEQWFDTMPECNARFLTEGISDHYPSKVTFTEERQRSRTSFQFCNVWTQHPQFMRIVKEGWNYNVERCKMFAVLKRLKMLKRGLKTLNTQAFHNIVTEVNEYRNTLKHIQIQLQRCPTNMEYQQAEVSAYQKFRQSTYLAEVEEETERVRAFNSIIRNGNRLSEAQQQEIMQPFLEREVKQAMFQIDNNKSPGPERFGSGFYKAAWSIVGRDITEAVLEFFQNGNMLSK